MNGSTFSCSSGGKRRAKRIERTDPLNTTKQTVERAHNQQLIYQSILR
jgi:hypothetical protein